MSSRSKPSFFASSRRARWCAGGVSLAILAATLGVGPLAAAGAADTPVVKTTDLPGSVGEAFLRLIDPAVSLGERRAAAMSLLNVSNKDAARALRSVLSEGASPVAWRAVGEAISLHPNDPPADLAGPMLALLPKADRATQAALAEGLGRFRSADLVERLVTIATDAAYSTVERRGAILALGHHRTQEVAGQLVALTGLDQPEPLQEAAFESLGTLTGLTEYGRDRGAWLDWWRSARRWPPARWHERVMANLARRDAVRRQQQVLIEDRLLDSQRALYRTTTPEDRPAVLAYMLADALEPIRHLAIDLSLQRLVDDLPFDEPLRDALRGRFGDDSPSIRQRAALLLRDLADQPSSDRAAAVLQGRAEQNVTVLRAYLLLLARMPRRVAVEPSLELLSEATVRDEAAAALAAALDAGMVDKKQANDAGKRIRRILESNPLPSPSLATLLAKVGNDDDWGRIARWIDSEDAALRRAAASAWAESDRPLAPLAARVGDPVIEPLVVAAAVRRGRDPATLRALSEHRPQQPAATAAWQEALVAMSGRVAAGVVLETVQRVEVAGGDAALLDRMLSAAIHRDDPGAPGPEQVVPLVLKRAEMRLASGNPAAALQDYARVAAAQAQLPATARLSRDAADRLARGRIHAHLRVGQIDEAFDVARDLIGPTGPGGGMPRTDDPVVDQFLEAARAHAEAGRRDPTRRMLNRLRLLLGPAIKPEIAQRIALLEAELAERGGSTRTAPIARDPDGAGSEGDESAIPAVPPASTPRTAVE